MWTLRSGALGKVFGYLTADLPVETRASHIQGSPQQVAPDV